MITDNCRYIYRYTIIRHLLVPQVDAELRAVLGAPGEVLLEHLLDGLEAGGHGALHHHTPGRLLAHAAGS